MRSYVYCYYNRKGGFYTAPVINPYDTEKIVEMTQRTFRSNVGEVEHTLQLENDLYYLGMFDDETGEFIIDGKPQFLTNFVEE